MKRDNILEIHRIRLVVVEAKGLRDRMGRQDTQGHTKMVRDNERVFKQ